MEELQKLKRDLNTRAQNNRIKIQVKFNMKNSKIYIPKINKYENT